MPSGGGVGSPSYDASASATKSAAVHKRSAATSRPRANGRVAAAAAGSPADATFGPNTPLTRAFAGRVVGLGGGEVDAGVSVKRRGGNGGNAKRGDAILRTLSYPGPYDAGARP